MGYASYAQSDGGQKYNDRLIDMLSYNLHDWTEHINNRGLFVIMQKIHEYARKLNAVNKTMTAWCDQN